MVSYNESPLRSEPALPSLTSGQADRGNLPCNRSEVLAALGLRNFIAPYFIQTAVADVLKCRFRIKL